MASAGEWRLVEAVTPRPIEISLADERGVVDSSAEVHEQKVEEELKASSRKASSSATGTLDVIKGRPRRLLRILLGECLVKGEDCTVRPGARLLASELALDN